jgi:hypothetical protein
VWFLSSLQSFHFDLIKSSEYKLQSLSFHESRDEIPFKGGSLSHPKISILECEPLFLDKFEFLKDFIYFHLK